MEVFLNESSLEMYVRSPFPHSEDKIYVAFCHAETSSFSLEVLDTQSRSGSTDIVWSLLQVSTTLSSRVTRPSDYTVTNVAYVHILHHDVHRGREGKRLHCSGWRHHCGARTTWSWRQDHDTRSLTRTVILVQSQPAKKNGKRCSWECMFVEMMMDPNEE